MEQKITITQDELYEFLLAHNIVTIRLGEMIGLAEVSLSSCFKHHKNNDGRPRYFTRRQVEAINEALPRLSYEVARRRIVFNPANNTSKSAKRVFDPGCVPQFKAVGEYFNLSALTVRVLGWNKRKKDIVINSPSNGSYGHITPDDVKLINDELDYVSYWLSTRQVLQNDSSSSSDDSN